MVKKGPSEKVKKEEEKRVLEPLEETKKLIEKEEKIEEVEEEKRLTREEKEKLRHKQELEAWKPKTELGLKVKAGKIKNIDEIFEKGYKILEPQIVDILIPNLKSELLLIGQAKGKFGGGKRRFWRQTQKKTCEGNVPSFACMMVVGDENGHVGIGVGKAKETLPAKEKAIRSAKLNLIKIERGCGSFDCSCNEKHSILLKVKGKGSSVFIELIPAPKGTGLAIENECKKIMKLAGIKDVYSRTFGQTRTKLNLAQACYNALKSTREVKK